MPNKPWKLVAATAFLLSTAGHALHSQGAGAAPEPGMLAARMANEQLKLWIGKAAAQMDDADYAFRPTPDIRSFGQLIAHIADQNYIFCSAAKGETAPMRDIEKNVTVRSEILKALTASMSYCDDVYTSTTEERGRTLVKFSRTNLPVGSVLIFRTHHNSLHYGNVVTYMRLRGKVPPSTEGRM